MIGRRLLHYEIVRRLGAGGMGEVWLARDTKLGREVAVKVLAPEFVRDHERLERFRREARAVAALNHPNIVTIFSVEEDDGLPFFTMEYVEGATLAGIIPDKGLGPARLLDLAIQITDAVSAAHDSGITHRDLKPGNIMVGSGGRIKVLDFGLARVGRGEPNRVHTESHLETDFLTVDGAILGTTPYMSPEQLKGKPVDLRSDIFSLGTILYAMATGRHPFMGDSSAEVISSILTHHPPEVHELRPGLPDFLSGVITRCLAKNPDDRYPSARHLGADLESLREGLRNSGTQPTVDLRGRSKHDRPALRLPRWVLAAGATVAAGAVVAALVIGRGAGPAPSLKVVAVMPFANLTGDTELDHLADGMTAGLTNRLREEQGLKVVSASGDRTATGRDPAAAAGGSGAGSAVGGEILSDGNRLAATTRLSDTLTGVVLWSHTYSAPAGELYGLDRVMAGDLATFLAIPLSEPDRRRLARGTEGADRALDHYVTGYRFFDRVDDLRGPDVAAENFREALRLDPDFALAHVGLSEALWEIYQRDFDRSVLEEAETHAREARRLAPELPEARLALARVLRGAGRHDEAMVEVEAALADHERADEVQREIGRNFERAGDLDNAERSFRAAAALRPGDWIGWNALGNFFARNGKYEESREAYEQAVAVAPADVEMPREKLATYNLQVGRVEDAIAMYESLTKPIRSPRLASNLATAYFFSERPDRWQRAEEYYLLAVRLSPQDPMYRMNLGDLYQRLDRTAEAQQSYLMARDLYETRSVDDPDNPLLMTELAFVSAKAGDCGRATGLARELEAVLPDTGPSAHQLAYVYALCGDGDAAVAAIARALAHGESAELIRQEDEFRSLRARPDFKALVGGGS